ncbi:MAG: YHYH protein [Planctomycetes bacterium]|nr:YHYH protein [Planctomycetota bacterium]
MKNRFIMLTVALLLFICGLTQAHQGHEHESSLKTWKTSDGLFEVKAFFLCQQDENVKLCKVNGSIISIPLSNLSDMDRRWVLDKSVVINNLNLPKDFELPITIGLVLEIGLLVAIAALSIYTCGIIFWQQSSVFPLAGAIALTSSMALFALDKDDKQSSAILVQKHFEPFGNKVKFRSDNDYFYIESQGMPDHPMMIGIRAWQQQVPIPQPYVGKNAWRIPLKPKLADNPVNAKTNLFRGAIALAVNGVPIFNPIKNDGKTDTFIAGELDEFGGHCGRADDYHYHTAPVHLQKIVGANNPIGYALDGFPLYGFTDADGKEPKDLDNFNGRIEQGSYRYYSTKKYPYVNGGLRGEVMVRDGQIDPQPRANPIRPDGRPLKGAKITGFVRDDQKKTMTVKYELNGRTNSIQYTNNGTGTYNFIFTDGNGNETKAVYQEKRIEGKEDKNKKGADKKGNQSSKKGGEETRLPWIAAHFDELDLDKDGYLLLSELKKEIEKTFTGFDSNKDGKLTKEEYSGKGSPVKSALAGFVKGHAEEFADKDGTITKDALTLAMTKMFVKADKKNTGKLSKEDASQSAKRQ